MGVSVGIDLGTTFSAVAIVDEKTKLPRVIPNREGAKITPSVIQFLDGQIIFGSEAESAFNAGEPGCAATFKRSMGSSEVYCVADGHAYTAEELSSLLLRHLKEDAEAALGQPIQDAVITVPAYFYSPEREATIRAATAAGIKVKKIIDEPNAAAMAYGLNNWRENANILVYDLGGGTFDVTLIHMEKGGELKTIVTRGDHLLGGRDWDNRIESLLFDKFEHDTELDLRGDHESVSIIRGLSEGVKKQLTVMTSVTVKTSLPDYGVSSVVITRAEFEDATKDLLDRTGMLCWAILEEAGLNKTDITDILLVGGSTRMPQVSQYLLGQFGKKPITHVNPDEAVALGAAIQATKGDVSYARLSVREEKGKKVTDRVKTRPAAVRPAKKLGDVKYLSLRETTAHAMGIIAINDDGNRYYNEIIIPANHPRPVRAAKRFRYYPSAEGNNEVEIYVLQGESENPVECLIPYKYVVSGIRYADKWDAVNTIIRVQYSYDENGVIHIQARQGRVEKDLPIRRDTVPSDVSRFGRPVDKDAKDYGAFKGLSLAGGSGNVVHKFKAITFSNAKWEPYDHILHHESGARYGEPKVHVIANERNIEFHGYNISQMDEGVTYRINAEDDFEIECDINTSTIKPHPGGNVIISLGIISAALNENGGNILLDGESVAAVGSKFKLRMSLTEGGHYEVYINGRRVGSKVEPTTGMIPVIFGFVHEAHCCELLSHAYITDIKMQQRVNDGADDESAEVPTWDD